MNNPITVSAEIYAEIDTVWQAYNDPTHIKKWNAASDAWYCSHSESVFREWWGFTHTMASKDGSMQFDLEWTYTKIVENELVAYHLNDERKVEVVFKDDGSITEMSISFEPERENDNKVQQQWWNAILNNFAQYAESL